MSGPVALAQSSEVTDQEAEVEKLTNEILCKEVDLERYYLHYRSLSTAAPRFRRIRYYLLQVASTSCTLASNIIFIDVARKGLKGDITDFGRGDGSIDQSGGSGSSSGGGSGSNSGGRSTGLSAGLSSGASGASSSGRSARSGGTSSSAPPQTKGKDTTGEVRGGIILATIGVILGPGSSLLELCSNAYTACKNLKQGNNPAAAVRNVVARIEEIDALLEQRSKIIEAHPELRALSINKAEHTVLVCFRDWCVSEFVDVYAAAKSTQAGANAYYMLDVANGGCNLAGNLLALRSLNPGKDGLAGPAATVSVVGDSLSIASAPASAVAGKQMYKFWHKRMAKKMSDHMNYGEDHAKAAMIQLNHVINHTDSAALKTAAAVDSRVSAYILWARRYDKIVEKQKIELAHRGKVAHQGQRIGPLLSGTGLAQDTLADVAFYGSRDNDRRGASLALAGAVTAGSGNIVGLAYTNYNLISEYLYRKKLRQQKLLPDQLLQERFKVLNQIDKMLDGTGKDGK